MQLNLFSLLCSGGIFSAVRLLQYDKLWGTQVIKIAISEIYPIKQLTPVNTLKLEQAFYCSANNAAQIYKSF